MRTPLVAGNWKMNKTITEARIFVSELVPLIQHFQNVEKLICPPFIDLMAVKALIQGTNIKLGCQNMHWEESGAFTGEVSPSMAVELCEYVILGHSERRAYFGETDEGVNKKVGAALNHGLVPIVCVGETLDENEAGITKDVVSRQVKEGLKDIVLSNANNLVIAYEPIWAIGTGKAATPEGANDVIGGVIRPVLGELFGQELKDQIRILYGGSVKANNANAFFSQPDIDGGLVGGACLKSDEFSKIIQAAI